MPQVRDSPAVLPARVAEATSGSGKELLAGLASWLLCRGKDGRSR